MKKKKIFTNKITNKIGNNQSFCEVTEEKETIEEKKDGDVSNKLDKLFNTNGYVFNIDVKIITVDKTYNTKIASRVGDNLITLDNDIIRICDIKDIIF